MWCPSGFWGVNANLVFSFPSLRVSRDAHSLLACCSLVALLSTTIAPVMQSMTGKDVDGVLAANTWVPCDHSPPFGS